jgi:hypothetical protein
LIKKSPGDSRTLLKKNTGELFLYLEELFTGFGFELRLAAACDGVLNSSVCWHTTHTHTGRTDAEHYNSYHQVLIGAIISTLNDLSIQIYRGFQGRKEYPIFSVKTARMIVAAY